MVLCKKLAECAGKIRDVNDNEKSDNTQQTDPLSKGIYGFAGSDIPVEPALIQVRIRKHDVPLAVDYVALPLLQAHGRKSYNGSCYNLVCFLALNSACRTPRRLSKSLIL